MIKADLIIIGSGPGGYRTAEYAAHHGLHTIVIESGDIGGTCLNCGCIPTKSLAHDAELAAQGLSIDFPHVMERKANIVQQLRDGVGALLSGNNLSLVKGKATFLDEKTIQVGSEEYTADHILIATGSSSKFPPGLYPSLLEEHSLASGNLPAVLTSTELLSIPALPKRLCIVGAGVIGMEFASIFNSFGVEVTVIEFLKECLPAVDADIAKRLRKLLEKRGITFLMQSAVKAIADGHVVFDKKGREESIEADLVLIATGRKPNIEGLNLDMAGIEYDHAGIKVDDNMETTVKGIYAIGDVNGRQMLAHAATFQGFRAVNHILAKPDKIRFDIMPAAIFTYPEAACVGKSEQQCKDEGLDVQVYKGYLRSNGRALAMDATEGMIKLMTDAHGKILGCHGYGVRSADMIQEIAALMNADMTIEDMKNIIHVHPTVGEVLQDMIQF